MRLLSIRNILTFCFLSSIAGCGLAFKDRNGSGVEPPKVGSTRLAGASWRLPKNPTVKLTRLDDVSLIAMTEELQVARSREGALGYVSDHPRNLFVLSLDKEPVYLNIGSFLPDLPEGAFVGDIASGEAGTFWLVASSFESEKLKHRIYHVDVSDHKVPKGALAHTSDAAWPEYDSLDDMDPFVQRYLPTLDTLDVARIDVKGNVLGLAARNVDGTLYATIFHSDYHELTLQHDKPLMGPPRNFRTDMSGGTYDVMGLLVNRYKFHGTFTENGNFMATSIGMPYVSAAEGESTEDGRANSDDSWPGIIRTGLTAEGQRTEMESIGTYDALLLDATSVREHLLLAVCPRRLNENGRSYPYLMLPEKTSSLRIDRPKSACVQSVAVHGEDQIFVGGSDSWEQNPAGLSISGGRSFFGRFNLRTGVFEAIKLSSYLEDRRSEVRDIYFPSKNVVCIGEMLNGPDTHAADHDESKIHGDGRVTCLLAR